MMSESKVVLLTDRAWPDTDIEHGLLQDAGLRLVAGPADAAPAGEIERLVVQHDPVAIMTCWAEVSALAITSARRLRVVTRMGVGLDNIAVEAATASAVQVTNVPDYCVEEVSDHAVGLVLNWTRGITVFDRDVRDGHWRPSAARLGRLRNKTVGIVGYGRIGRATARKLQAFGCTVLANDLRPNADVEYASLDDLLTRSDIVVLHAPLGPATHHLIGARELGLMRPWALLVNVSRGGLVDTGALERALEAGQLAAAALDVLEQEPEVPPGLVRHRQVTVTPHIAFSSDASVEELRTKATQDVIRVLTGQPPHYPCNTPSPAVPAGSHE
ncbi:C-terminal binding protein [Spirillospora sp. CA-255316]